MAATDAPSRGADQYLGTVWPVRIVALVALGAVAWAWVSTVGLPSDPVQLAVWGWLTSIAWHLQAPLRQHLGFLRDWSPAVLLLVAYTWTRGVADQLGMPLNTHDAIAVDRWLGAGRLPGERLQAWLCSGPCTLPYEPRWFDLVFGVVYISHFFVALGVAVVLYLRSRTAWRDWMIRWLTLCALGLVCYIVYPLRPPWLAIQDGFLDADIERLAGPIWAELGVELQSVLTGASVNLVAAMPSLHQATAVLVAVYAVQRLRWWGRWLLLVYPVLMGLSLVYLGEHYVVDLAAGTALALGVLAVFSSAERRSRATGSPAAQDALTEGAAASPSRSSGLPAERR